MSILNSTKTGKVAFLIPKNKRELTNMIENEIKEKGFNCDLNHIQTHKITDMSYLFSHEYRLCLFNGDISKWDVSNVENMCAMFWNSNFNGDVSKWNVSNVISMQNMFYISKFNGDISRWNVSNVINTEYMFARSNFNKDISNWQLNPKCNTYEMFLGCEIKDIYKPKYL